MATGRPLAVVTGASTGIGYELAKCCIKNGFDLLVVADEAKIERAADTLKAHGGAVEALQADLATLDGVDELYRAIGGRPVSALLANAGRGLGKGFLDQDFDEIRHVIDTNVTGTLYLVHKVGNDMRRMGEGKILITGSIAGFMPGTFQAVYNGTKAFIDSFAAALREEIKDTGVTVTCLMPGATETEFFERADLMDTKIGQKEKDDPADVAQLGFEAMRDGKDHVIYGFKNKMQVAAAKVLPSSTMAEQHRKETEPGSAAKH
jgi:short-subunit dehydrogenase